MGAVAVDQDAAVDALDARSGLDDREPLVPLDAGEEASALVAGGLAGEGGVDQALGDAQAGQLAGVGVVELLADQLVATRDPLTSTATADCCCQSQSTRTLQLKPRSLGGSDRRRRSRGCPPITHARPATAMTAVRAKVDILDGELVAIHAMCRRRIDAAGILGTPPRIRPRRFRHQVLRVYAASVVTALVIKVETLRDLSDQQLVRDPMRQHHPAIAWEPQHSIAVALAPLPLPATGERVERRVVSNEAQQILTVCG